MKKYYKIPLTERLVYVGEKSLYQILQDNYQELYNREVGRIELIYGDHKSRVMTSTLQEKIDAYNTETKKLYKTMNVPTHIIGFDNNGDLVEYATKTPLNCCSKETFLHCRQVSQLEAYEYLNNQDGYLDMTDKLFYKKTTTMEYAKRLASAIYTKIDK